MELNETVNGKAYIHPYYDDRMFRMFDVCQYVRGRQIVLGVYANEVDAEAHVRRLNPPKG